MEREFEAGLSPSLAPEHDWAAASRLIHPSLRPPGTAGVDGRDPRPGTGNGLPGRPLVAGGPAGLPIVYVIPCDGFDVLVGADHLLSWGVGPEDVHAAAMTNLAAWSAGAAWIAENDGPREVLLSDTGEGMDAARILLPDVRGRLAADLAPADRILIALPERDLLIAAGLAAGDIEFAEKLAGYVAELSAAAHDPIDGRLFELVDGDLVESSVLTTA